MNKHLAHTIKEKKVGNTFIADDGTEKIEHELEKVAKAERFRNFKFLLRISTHHLIEWTMNV